MDQENQPIIDINLADAEALTQMQGIGGRLAERIIEARPFKNIDDLTRVRGISEKSVNRLRPFLSISKTPEPVEASEDDDIEERMEETEEADEPMVEEADAQQEIEAEVVSVEAVDETITTIPEIEDEVEAEVFDEVDEKEDLDDTSISDQSEPVEEVALIEAAETVDSEEDVFSDELEPVVYMAIKTCPYLGLKTDPDTPLSFASEGNYCHRAKPIAPINRDHQIKYCLSGKYHSCKIFVRLKSSRLPLALYSYEHRQRKISRVLIIISILVLLIYTTTMANVWWEISGSNWYSNYLKRSSSDDMGRAIPLLGVPSQTPFRETDLKLPSATLSEDFPLSVQETIEPPERECKIPEGWVIYTVQPTDSLFRLSLLLGISVADIRAANCFSEDEIVHSGQVVYIPPEPTITPTPTPTSTPTIRRQLPTLTYTPKPTVKQQKPKSPPPTSTPKPTQKPPTSTSIPTTESPTQPSEPTPTLAPPN